MAEMHRRRPPADVLRLALATIAMLAVAACGPGERAPADTGSASGTGSDTTGTAADTTTPLGERLLSEFAAYAGSLSYDTARTAGSTDTLIWRMERGPAARIHAAPGLESFDPSSLTGNQSRLLGRIVTPPGSDFPRFGVRGAVTFVALTRSDSGDLQGVWFSAADSTTAATTKVKDVMVVLPAALCPTETPCQARSATKTGRAPDPGGVVSFASLLHAAQGNENKKFDRLYTGTDSVTTQGCWKTATGWVCSPSKLIQ